MPNRNKSLSQDFADIHQKVADLLETGLGLHADLLDAVQTRTESTESGEYTALPPTLETNYEAWYSLSLRLVSSVLPERAEDFQRLYWTRSSLINMRDYLVSGRTQHAQQLARKLQNQIALLRAAQSVLRSVLVDLRGTLQADLFDSELDAAASLLKNGFLRGAGAMAGVVLERHLQSVCDSHGVAVEKTVTISKLNAALKKAAVLELADWRRIQLLGDLRNKCDHQREQDPTSEDVTELIDGVVKTIKKVF